MGIIGRQAIKGSIYIYLGVVAGFISSGLILPKILSTEQIGLIKIIMAYSAIFGQFATLGFVPVTTKIFPHFRNSQTGNNGFLLLSLLIGVLGYLAFLLLFYFFKDLLLDYTQTNNILLSRYLPLIIIISGFTSFFLILDAYARSLFYTSIGLFIKEFIFKFINTLLVIFLAFNLFTFDTYLKLFLMANFVPILLILIFLKCKTELKITDFFNTTFYKHYKEMITIGIYGIVSGFSGILVINIDSIMISTIEGLDAAGVYATVFYFAFIINIPYRAMERVTAAIISEKWKEGDLVSINTIYKRSSTNQTIMASLLFILIWINHHNLFLFLPPAFSEGKYALLFLTIGYLLNMSFGVNNSIIGTSDRYQFQTYLQILMAILLVATNYIFIPIFGLTGAAFATMLSLAILNMVKFLFIKLRFNMQPFNINVLIVLAVAGAILGINQLVFPKISNIYVDSIYRSVILGGIFTFTIYKLSITEEFNSIIERLVKKMTRK